jgi:hypothetical protein
MPFRKVQYFCKKIDTHVMSLVVIIASVIVLSVVILRFVMLRVVMLLVVMLNVVLLRVAMLVVGHCAESVSLLSFIMLSVAMF